MTSTAISAQGSKLQIGTGTGGAKALSAIALGFPTILTSAGHGLVNGDVVTLDANFAGADAAVIDSKVVTIKNVTTDTFAVDVNTTDKTITIGTSHATPVTWTEVGNLKSFSGFDGQATELDRTNMDSAAKEIAQGLVDFGQLTIDCDYDYSDAGQAALLAAQAAATIQTFKLTLPDTHTASFTAFVKKIPTTGGVDKILGRAGITLRISGAVTWA